MNSIQDYYQINDLWSESLGTLRQKYVLQLPEVQARYPLDQIWQPTRSLATAN